MAVKAKCPGCGRTFQADDKFAGKTAKCPDCKTGVCFPGASAVDPNFDDFDDFLNAEIGSMRSVPPPPITPKTAATRLQSRTAPRRSSPISRNEQDYSHEQSKIEINPVRLATAFSIVLSAIVLIGTLATCQLAPTESPIVESNRQDLPAVATVGKEATSAALKVEKSEVTPSIVESGFTEAQRMEIFSLLLRSRHRALDELHAKYLKDSYLKTWNGYNDLQVGQVIVVSNAMNLVPGANSRSLEDISEALTAVVRVPTGTAVTILERKPKSSDHIDYLGKATIRGQVEVGWFNGLAVMSQFISDAVDLNRMSEQLHDELLRKYESEVMKRFSLNKEQVNNIHIEGFKNEWPLQHFEAQTNKSTPAQSDGLYDIESLAIHLEVEDTLSSRYNWKLRIRNKANREINGPGTMHFLNADSLSIHSEKIPHISIPAKEVVEISGNANIAMPLAEDVSAAAANMGLIPTDFP